MPEIRHDQLSDFSSIDQPPDKDESKCDLCSSHDRLVLSIKKVGNYIRISREEDAEWDVKVIRSLHPLFDESFSGDWGEGPFRSEPAKGTDEVIVLGAVHLPFHDLGVQLISEGLYAAQEDIKAISSRSHITYVSMALNSALGVDHSGHPALSITGLTFIPRAIMNEVRAFKDEYDNRASCPVCEMVKAEMNGTRQIYRSDNFIVVSPWSPARDNEIRILPILHSKPFQKLTQKEIDDLALILKLTGSALHRKSGRDYGIAFRLNPVKRSSLFYHWYMSIFNINGARDMYRENLGIIVMDRSQSRNAEPIARVFRESFTEYMGVPAGKPSSKAPMATV